MKNIINKLMTFFLSFMLFNLQIHSVNGEMSFSMSKSVQAAENVVTSSNAQGQEGYLQLDGSDSGGLMGKIASPAVALLVYMASAFVIYKLIMACKPVTTDVIGAAIAAGIYIIGEVQAIMTGEQKLKAKTIEYKTYAEDETIDSEQYEVLVKEKQALKQIKSATEKRMKMQNAAALAFGVSAGLAVFKEAKSKSLAFICAENSKVVAVSCQAASCAVVTAETIAKESQESLPNFSSVQVTALKTLEAKITSESLLCVADAGKKVVDAAACVPAAGAASTSCSTYVLNEQMDEIACVPLSVVDNEKSKVQKWYASLFDKLLISKANAKAGKLLGTVAGLVGGYLLVESKKIDMLISTPKKRAILWGGLGVFGKLVANNSKKTVSKIEDNIKIIDEILNKMDATMAKGIDVSSEAVAGSTISGVNAVNSYPTGPLGSTVDCLNGSSSGGCNNLPKPKIIPELEKNFPSLPNGLNGAFSDMLGFAGEVQGKGSISPRAASKIESLNSRASAINGALKRGQDNLNKVRKKLGLKKLNLAKESADAFANRVKSADQYFKKKGQNPNSMLAKFGGAGSFGGRSSRDGSDASRAADMLSGDLKGGDGLNDSGSGEGLSGASAPGQGEFNFDFDQDAIDSEVAQRNAEFDKMAQQASEIDSDQDSIIEDSSVSIFKVISTRYLKSGYKKLLEEIK